MMRFMILVPFLCVAGRAAKVTGGCFSDNECVSGFCRGGSCCTDKGASTGCTECLGGTGDCMTCGEGYKLVDWECFSIGETGSCDSDSECSTAICRGGNCCNIAKGSSPLCIACYKEDGYTLNNFECLEGPCHVHVVLATGACCAVGAMAFILWYVRWNNRRKTSKKPRSLAVYPHPEGGTATADLRVVDFDGEGADESDPVMRAAKSFLNNNGAVEEKDSGQHICKKRSCAVRLLHKQRQNHREAMKIFQIEEASLKPEIKDKGHGKHVEENSAKVEFEARYMNGEHFFPCDVQANNPDGTCNIIYATCQLPPFSAASKELLMFHQTGIHHLTEDDLHIDVGGSSGSVWQSRDPFASAFGNPRMGFWRLVTMVPLAVSLFIGAGFALYTFRTGNLSGSSGEVPSEFVMLAQHCLLGVSWYYPLGVMAGIFGSFPSVAKCMRKETTARDGTSITSQMFLLGSLMHTGLQGLGIGYWVWFYCVRRHTGVLFVSVSAFVISALQTVCFCRGLFIPRLNVRGVQFGAASVTLEFGAVAFVASGWVARCCWTLACIYFCLLIPLSVLGPLAACKANQIVADDKREYDMLWAKLKHQLKRQDGEALEQMRLDNQNNSLRQSVKVAGWPVGAKPKMKDRDKKTIATLKAVWAAALEVNPTFQALCEDWANRAGTKTGKHVSSSRGPIKKVTRAIQKLQRSYGMDNALRLLDVVRASIVCEDFESLVEVVRLIKSRSGQGTYAVRRMKNRFRNDFNSSESGGYRNCSFIIKVEYGNINYKHERKSFLCELQLDLEDYSTMKHELGGHKRYVSFRNLRGD